MAKILVTAENFAFGPVGKLLTVTDTLVEKGHSVTFLGFGTALQLAKKARFSRVIELNTDAPEFNIEAKKVFIENNLLLSCMDRSSLILANKLNIPTIWLDTLFWWWDNIPDYMLNADLYIKQNSINDDKNLRKYSSVVKNLHGVGPIVDTRFTSEKKLNQVLVAFGGMEGAGWYKVGVDTNYPYIITELLVNQVNFQRYDEIIITGNERVINDLASIYKLKKKFKFKTLSHEKFLEELGRSKLALIVPGLETPLEVFAYKVPAVFLPPSNSSQYVQLDEFIKHGAGEASIHLRDFFPELKLNQVDLKEKMRLFLDQLREYEKNTQALDETAMIISNLINNDTKQRKQLLGQNRYVKLLGNNGLPQVLELINNFITERHL